MKSILKKIFLNNVQIKIISLILGYSFWYLLSQMHVANIWLDTPICFYNVPENLQIESVDKVKILLSAKRADLYTLNKETLAFHIDMQDAHLGNRIIKLKETQLLLPETIKLVRQYPVNIALTIKENKNIKKLRKT